MWFPPRVAPPQPQRKLVPTMGRLPRCVLRSPRSLPEHNIKVKTRGGSEPPRLAPSAARERNVIYSTHPAQVVVCRELQEGCQRGGERRRSCGPLHLVLEQAQKCANSGLEIGGWKARGGGDIGHEEEDLDEERLRYALVEEGKEALEEPAAGALSVLYTPDFPPLRDQLCDDELRNEMCASAGAVSRRGRLHCPNCTELFGSSLTS